MPTDLETQNLIIVGAPGTGKSQAINCLVASALRRDDRMVVVDPNGSLMSRFYLPGDAVINPYDARCVGWSLFNEVGLASTSSASRIRRFRRRTVTRPKSGQGMRVRCSRTR